MRKEKVGDDEAMEIASREGTGEMYGICDKRSVCSQLLRAKTLIR